MTTIGIDLGTTNSCVAYYDGTRPVVIEMPGGSLMMPSVVGFSETGQMIVGNMARRQISRKDPRYIFSNIKRHIGMLYVDGEEYGIQITRGDDGSRHFVGPDRTYSPEELSAEILKALKSAAERRLGKKATDAVITVPAYFDNNQVRATMEAGKIAGFRRVHIFTEPEASALAYGVEKAKFSRVGVFDLGGGTFDIVLMKAGMGTIEIIDKDGWTRLGGINFDERIRDYVVERYAAENGVDLRTKQISMLKIAPAAEGAKKDLTEEPEAALEIMNAAFDPEEAAMRDISFRITREEFESRCRDLVDKAMEISQRCMDRAGWRVEQVDEVLLVGGMTRVPMVREAVADMFGGDKLRDSVSPDLAVALGAAIKAALIDGRLSERVSTNDTLARPFGLEIVGGVMQVVLPRGSAPGDIRTVIVTTAKDKQDVIPIAVLQGEGGAVDGASVIARYDHSVDPGPAGSQSVELDFMVDENGLLFVTGKDKDTGKTFEVAGAT